MNHLRFALRQFGKSPGFTAIAVLTLALGIASATTLFSVIQALVIHPFPYPDAEQIVYVRSNSGQPLSTADYNDLVKELRSLSELGAYVPRRINLGGERAESVPAILCTSGVLRALGIQPMLGRWFTPSDDEPGAEAVAVISHALWLQRFQGDSAVVGSVQQVDGRATRIVGVMPATFEFSSPWYQGSDYQLWAPLHFTPDEMKDRGSHWMLGLGRLKPGVTLAQADAEIKAVGARLAAAYPDTNTGKPFLAVSIRQEITRQTASGLRPLGAAVVLLMLVVCANVAGLLLARGKRREAEFGIRLALGASRKALALQLLGETLVLALLGCAVGVILSLWGVAVVRNLIPATLIIEARRAAIDVHGWVLPFAAGAGLLAALLSGVAPAITAVRGSVGASLHESGRTQTGSRVHRRLLRRLVMAQTAVTVLLAYGAILFTGSYVNVVRANRALETDQVLTVEIAPKGERYKAVGTRIQFWNAMMERVRSLPGVERAAMTTKLPLEGGNNFDVLADGETFDAKVRRPLVENSGVSPDYFAAMGIGWLRGNPVDFVTPKGPVFPAVINQTLARKVWPQTDPLQHQLRINMPNSPYVFQVVGVVEDVRQWGAEAAPMPELYYACTLNGLPEEALPPNSAYLVVRARGDARGLTAAIREELARLDPGLAVSRVRTMSGVLHDAGSSRRFSSGLVNLFTTIAVVLAAIGVYGTLSYNLAQRTREFGVRIAVGAQRRHIFALVLAETSRWLLGGLLPGIALSVGCAFAAGRWVYGVDPLSPLTVLLGAGGVGVVLLLACLAPARRATRINPVDALRAE
ncbi:permease [Opitutaceae bacterium EW11]|nr:permease [Opitutaceae bacterium EW11]